MRFPRQAQFHPLKYLAGLAKRIKEKGGRIYTETHATEIEGGKQARIETSSGGVVIAGAVVVATNTPVNDLIAIHTKQAAYQTYVIGARIPKDRLRAALYWDTPDPYHYLRIETVGKGADSLRRSDCRRRRSQDGPAGRRQQTLRRARTLDASSLSDG